MQYLNTFLTLLSKTQSRDKILRLVQYATLHSEEDNPKGATFNAYNQIRRTRKWLRFLRTIEVIVKIKKDFQEMKETKGIQILVKALGILQAISTLLFYLFDHYVVLGQLQLLPKEGVSAFQPKSLKAYLWQNIFGAIKNLLQILVLTHNGKLNDQVLQEQSQKKGMQVIKTKTVEFIRNILDIFVGCYYINKPKNSAARIGVIGIATSLIGIGQSLKII